MNLVMVNGEKSIPKGRANEFLFGRGGGERGERESESR